jgi:hypothetical protein
MTDYPNNNYQAPLNNTNNPNYPAAMQHHHTTNTVVLQQQQPTIIIIEKSSYPSVNKCLAIIILLLNCIIPGFGTILMGCSSQNCGEWLCTGILQFLLCPLLIGWIWSICTGLKCLNHSR